jgi:hypothetical protein
MNRKVRGRKRAWPYLRYYPSIWLEGLRKTTAFLIRSTGFVVFHDSTEISPFFFTVGHKLVSCKFDLACGSGRKPCVTEVDDKNKRSV